MKREYWDYNKEEYIECTDEFYRNNMYKFNFRFVVIGDTNTVDIPVVKGFTNISTEGKTNMIELPVKIKKL